MMYGKCITSPNDPLQAIGLEILAAKIKQPKDDMIDTIEQLKFIRSVDSNRYKELKKKLPYVVAGNFQPNYRKLSNFVSTRYAILDLDHLEGEEHIRSIKARCTAETGVKCAFTSPGGNGLKLVMELEAPCTDAQRFSVFYKLFAIDMMRRWSLEKWMDTKTNDVSRACFISYDPELIWNEEVHKIDWRIWTFEDNWHQTMARFKEAEKAERTESIEPKEKTEIDKDTVARIRERMGMLPVKAAKQHIQPPELEELVAPLEAALIDMGLTLTGVKPISYGRQLHISDGSHWAEINLFYGKKGFSVVQTTKSGSYLPLADSLAEWMKRWVNQ
jgi:hypothetical protein